MNVYYLTWLKSRIGQDTDNIIIDNNITISSLLDILEKKGNHYSSVFQNRHVIYAEVDGNIVEHDKIISNENDVYLFGPIVGG